MTNMSNQITNVGKKGNQRWYKGMPSPNPNGRSGEVVEALREVRAAASKHCVEAIECLVRLMRTSRHDAVKLAGATELLNRAVGKPVANVDIEHSGALGLIQIVTAQEPKVIEQK